MSLKESLSALLLRLLPQSAFLKVRAAYLRLRQQGAPLLKLIYGTFTTEELINEIDRRIDERWDFLMVHSSVNSMLPMYEGSALELLRALIEYVGPERTLVMPAFNFGEMGEGARPSLQRNPRFDLRRTPSQMGLLTELFRRSRGVVQSRHPVYRVAALGPRAQEIIADHELAPTGMGENTPFDVMAKHNAQILGIGKTFQVMTQVHHVESLLGENWPAPQTDLPPIDVVIVEKDRETPMSIGGAHQKWTFNIWKLRETMPPDKLREWSFHHCPLFAARAGEVTEALVTAAQRNFVLYDP